MINKKQKKNSFEYYVHDVVRARNQKMIRTYWVGLDASYFALNNEPCDVFVPAFTRGRNNMLLRANKLTTNVSRKQ